MYLYKLWNISISLEIYEVELPVPECLIRSPQFTLFDNVLPTEWVIIWAIVKYAIIQLNVYIRFDKLAISNNNI